MKKNTLSLILIIVIFAVGVVLYWQQRNTTKENAQPVINLISPNGGETFTEGLSYTIAWSTKNIPDTDKISINIRRVAPPPLPTEGQEFDPLIATNLENTGSYAWTVSDTYPDGNYFLGITSYASLPITNPITDESDAIFKITKNTSESTTTQLTYFCNDNKSIQATFYTGEVKPVESGQPPVPTGSVKVVLSDGRTLDLNQTISADGIRYANTDESFVFWSKGNEALILENNVEKSYLGCAAWKKYQNQTHNFELLYPTDWQVRENDGEQYEPVNGNKLVELSNTICCQFSFDEGLDFKIFYSDGFTKYPDLKNIVSEKQKIYPVKNYSVKSYKVANFEGVLSSVKIGGAEYAELYLKDTAGFYTVLWNTMDPNKKGFTAANYLEKIISSFEFTNERVYKNNDYGFQITLPGSWRGYSVLSEAWNGQTVDEKATKYQGPKIIIRNPNWTQTKLWQDIPVMVFTPDQWKLIETENLAVSAAPIGPSKLGENTKYVFALPPRWVGFTDALGQDEAVKITQTFKAF
jgi:membrane-bound inhibitor of C-type lysozyme